MRRTLLGPCVLALSLGGCGFFGSGQDEVRVPSNTIADANNPLAVRANYLAGNADYTFLSTAQLLSFTEPPISISDAVIERRYDGFIIWGTVLASTQGFTKPVLVRDPEAFEKDPNNLVYLVRLTPPAGQSPVGNAVNREVLFAGFLPNKDAAHAHSITLVTAQNKVTRRVR